MITFWLSYAYDLLGMLYDVSSYMFHKYNAFWSVLFHVYILHLTSLTSPGAQRACLKGLGASGSDGVPDPSAIYLLHPAY